MQHVYYLTIVRLEYIAFFTIGYGFGLLNHKGQNFIKNQLKKVLCHTTLEILLHLVIIFIRKLFVQNKKH